MSEEIRYYIITSGERPKTSKKKDSVCQIGIINGDESSQSALNLPAPKSIHPTIRSPTLFWHCAATKAISLVPAIYKTVTLKVIYKKEKHKGQQKAKQICEEKAVTYKADFVYFDNDKKIIVIEDCKGMRTKEYIIKRKLMKHLYCNETTIFVES